MQLKFYFTSLRLTAIRKNLHLKGISILPLCTRHREKFDEIVNMQFETQQRLHNIGEEVREEIHHGTSLGI